jgi:hypothetical protein
MEVILAALADFCSSKCRARRACQAIKSQAYHRLPMNVYPVSGRYLLPISEINTILDVICKAQKRDREFLGNEISSMDQSCIPKLLKIQLGL